MRWLLFLYFGSLAYAYSISPPLERPIALRVGQRSSRVFEGRLVRRPQSVDSQENTVGLSNTSVLVEQDPALAGSQDGLIHLDGYGLVVQADGDGGDTAQRTGMLFYEYDDADAFRRSLDQLEIGDGVYVRHPYQDGFRGDPNQFSRDQQRPLVIALGEYGMYDRLWRLTKAHLLRFGKYQNNDYLGPAYVGEYVRAFKAWPVYPVLWFTDFGLLVSSIDIAISSRYDAEDVDDNNHLMSLIQAQNVMPTPVSWLARKVYKRFRPINAGNTVLREADPVQGALCWYHRADSGGNPFIAEIYRKAVSEL